MCISALTLTISGITPIPLPTSFRLLHNSSWATEREASEAFDDSHSTFTLDTFRSLSSLVGLRGRKGIGKVARLLDVEDSGRGPEEWEELRGESGWEVWYVGGGNVIWEDEELVLAFGVESRSGELGGLWLFTPPLWRSGFGVVGECLEST